MKNLFKSFFLVLLIMNTSCNLDDDTTSTPISVSIADVVANSSNFSMLLEALNKTGLDATLAGAGDFTVFAPDNNAFTEFLDGASLSDVSNDVLTQLLLNHVLGESLASTELSTSYVNNLATEATSTKNLSMYINTGNGVTINGISKVTETDVTASNGIIHVVDKVIPLPTIVTFATADATFSNLVAALTRDDQPDFVGTLSTSAGVDPTPFTVFAPTDDAFASLISELLNVNTLADIDTATLTATLNMHVIAGANIRKDDLVSGEAITLGGTVTINAENATITDANDRISNVIVTDVQASNGVIHVIDKVILPPL